MSNLILKRKIEQKLIEWKNAAKRDALLINGARQIGKSTIIKNFGNKHYKHFIELNFIEKAEYRKAFDGNLDAKTIILNLSAMGVGPFVAGETLIFFDEIQKCPNARTAIKFLVQDGRFDYIESGSLLGISYNEEVSSYPVGFEDQLEMYPMDFEEFLWAKNISDDVIEQMKECYEQVKPLPEFLHEQIMKLYREFIIVGGMPEAVVAHITTSDFNETLRVQNKLLAGYRADIANYAGKDKLLTRNIFDAIPEQLAKENKRFVLASLEKGAGTRKYEDASMWLSEAGIGYHCFNMNALELPFAMYAKRNLYKLYIVDTGLLCALSMDGIQAQILQGQIEINEGGIAENAIACELAKKNIPLYYYDHKSRCELDFIIKENKRLSVLEVKSGRSYKKHASLDNVIAADENKDKFERKIVFCKYNISRGESDIIYYPLYMAMFLKNNTDKEDIGA